MSAQEQVLAGPDRGLISERVGVTAMQEVPTPPTGQPAELHFDRALVALVQPVTLPGAAACSLWRMQDLTWWQVLRTSVREVQP
ncbi:hypothetical protein F0344_00295 [Streptomyces finlayi]|uniref:Uncharacterized protein n=1 Tax=Streptomyces finlayi TaxID=67296 RepID=A0A7G7BD61_9ACTN|nr:hypothetical protein [Streptomyces finlayi]QNE73276.1 hypothetical protein F0344_00295 [Streptomyces finlayi]